MGTSKAAPRRRTRGEIETLPSGSLRVKVYAGNDPLTGRRHYITETVPPGPRAEKEAEKVRTKQATEPGDTDRLGTQASHQ